MYFISSSWCLLVNILFEKSRLLLYTVKMDNVIKIKTRKAEIASISQRQNIKKKKKNYVKTDNRPRAKRSLFSDKHIASQQDKPSPPQIFKSWNVRRRHTTTRRARVARFGGSGGGRVVEKQLAHAGHSIRSVIARVRVVVACRSSVRRLDGDNSNVPSYPARFACTLGRTRTRRVVDDTLLNDARDRSPSHRTCKAARARFDGEPPPSGRVAGTVASSPRSDSAAIRPAERAAGDARAGRAAGDSDGTACAVFTHRAVYDTPRRVMRTSPPTVQTGWWRGGSSESSRITLGSIRRYRFVRLPYPMVDGMKRFYWFVSCRWLNPCTIGMYKRLI